MPGIAHIGFDFGSSLIKVAVRLEDVGETGAAPDAAFGIAFEGHSKDGPYRVFRPTELGVTGDGDGRRIQLRGASADARPITEIKERLMGGFYPQGTPLLDAPLDGSGLTVHEGAALLLASTLCDVRAAIEHYARDRNTRRPDTILVNCAVPSADTMSAQTRDALSETACPHRRAFLELMERARRWVFRAGYARVPDELSLSEARKIAREILSITLPDAVDAWGTTCIPEALAAVTAAIRHAQFRQGLFFVFDVGAYTTDASLFHFHPAPEYQIMVYYGIGSSRAGIGRDAAEHVGDAAAAELRRQLEDMYRVMLESMLEEHGDQFTRGLLRHHPRPNSPKWKAVVLGGGANRDHVRRAIDGLALPSKSAEGFRVAPTGEETLRFPVQTYSHIVFIHQRGGAACTKPLDGLRQSWRHYAAALERPSSILQLGLGLASGAFRIPSWSAGEPVTPTNRPDAVSKDAWRTFHPWAEY